MPTGRAPCIWYDLEAKKDMPGRVLYIQHAGSLGGSATSLRFLVESMQTLGIDCTVALARPCRELVDFYNAAGIATIPIPEICCWDHSTVAPRSLANPRHVLDLCSVAKRWRASERATLQLVDRLKPDLVHLNSMPLSSSARAMTREGVPFVWHVREPPPDQGVRTKMIRSLMTATPHCVFITEYDRRAWIGEAPARIVYNAAPDEWFGRSLPAATSASDGGLVRFAYVGGLSIAKGVEVLLQALRILNRRATGWECVMPACLVDPHYARKDRLLKRAARALGIKGAGDRLLPQFQSLAPAVQLRTFDTDIPALFQSVDFIVFPAVSPHFPRPVIEAAALGRPSIGTDVGGVNECIVHRETGLLCPPGDPESLAAAIAELIADRALARRLGEAAHARAAAVHTLSAQRRVIADVYGEVLASCSGVRR